jgi:hypothetical protein
MTTKTNKTAIGAFVLGGILLLIAGVVVVYVRAVRAQAESGL